jgi:hypothetical protein
MTVKQLIEKLSQIEDQDLRVMVKGYEGGYDDLVIGNGDQDNTPVIIKIALDVNDEWYYGRHERIENIYQRDLENYTIVKAIIL